MITNVKTELYTYIYPEGSQLFRATDYNSLNISDIPLWFGEKENIARKYTRKYLYEFKTKRDFRLLNITHPLFHQDFMNKLMIMYRDYEARFNGTELLVPDDVLHALLPIGLFGIESQIDFLSSQRVDLSHINNNTLWNESFQKYVDSCFGGKHRYSVYERDLNMVKLMRWLYREYDGYIIPVMWPSKLLDGLFNREICLFRGYDSLTPTKFSFLEQKAGKKKKQSGGILQRPKTAMEASFDEDRETQEQNDKFVRETCLHVGYTLEPPKHPVTGWLELPPVEEIERFKKETDEQSRSKDLKWQPIKPEQIRYNI